ncbi:type IV pilus modification protein PilV [Stutzerimonas stutzeri]|uniref:type IV pilus modification protein PilV n=1 Tax=Stutzerimonas stutzeri TaxID=316 RepID=UPI00210900AC|nr:type IV pilus modification protein PilV [Stutzerimonas stutzeri]MCQ4322064.1 type IV pilus modification protein PilV [Stutzerimonas stutzeri]
MNLCINRAVPLPPTRQQQGATLIEVLVALLVLSVGLLGMAGLQMTSAKSNYSAYQRSQATLLAYDITDRMRANREAADQYEQAFTAATCDREFSGSGSTLIERDKSEWLNAVACLLPDGQGQISTKGDLLMITIRWNDNRGRIEEIAGTDRQSFEYTTLL